MMMRRTVSAAMAALFAASLVGTAHAGGARVTVSCSFSGSIMTVTFSAKTRGGGKPQDIASAGPVVLVVDEGAKGQYNKVVGLGVNISSVDLPATATFDLCTSEGSMVNGESNSVRGRGMAFISGVGFVGNECSPLKPPAC